MNPTPLFDLSLIGTWLEGDEEMIRSHVRSCLQQLDAVMEELAKSAERNDTKALSASAHRIRGSLASLGAVSAAAVARDVEHSAARGEKSDVDVLEIEVDKVAGALVVWLDGERDESEIR